MNRKFVLFLLAASFTSGCIAFARFYPVQGPLSNQTPVPVYKAKLTGGFTSGSMSLNLGSGDVCKGSWAEAHTESPSPATGTPVPPSAMTMPAVWDAVYGQGFYVAHILGAKLFARAQATCQSGATINVEMYRRDSNRPDTPIEIHGVAKDSKDNIYKVVI
jgi:hypothetical protein